LFEEVVRLRKENLGPESVDTLVGMHNLSASYERAGRYQEAVQVQEATLGLHRKVMGAEHRETLEEMRSLAVGYRKAGRYEEALRLATETWELTQKILPPDDPQTLRAKGTLGAVCSDAGRVGEAITLLEETVQRQQEVEGPQHRQTLATMQLLAIAAGGGLPWRLLGSGRVVAGSPTPAITPPARRVRCSPRARVRDLCSSVWVWFGLLTERMEAVRRVPEDKDRTK
jgi:tetratricopeptide (TPR) repeat protein